MQFQGCVRLSALPHKDNLEVGDISISFPSITILIFVFPVTPTHPSHPAEAP